MQRLVRKLTILGLLMGALIFLALPQPALADIHECDANMFSTMADCGGLYFVCLEYNRNNPGNPQDCDALMNACLGGAGTTLNECINASYVTPRPLPVINEARSQCNMTCQDMCSGIENLGERTECLNPCIEYCDETYPRQ
jgi:hypothetical protein